MSTIVLPSSIANYRTSSLSETFSYGDDIAEHAERISQFGDDISRLIMLSSTNSGQLEGGSARASNASEAFSTMASLISAVRFVFTWERFVSLKMFYDDKGNRRDWMLIATDVCLLVARTLSPLTLLHDLNVIDLGRHAKAMGSTIVVAISAVVVLTFAYCVRDTANTFQERLLSEENKRERENSVRESVVAFFDVIALPCQCVPTFGIAGCVISALSTIVYFVQQYYNYR